MGRTIMSSKKLACLVVGLFATAAYAFPQQANYTNATLMIGDSSCDEGDSCYDMRMQNVEGCTTGWTLHGLWPQWAESCTHEKFDISQLTDIQDDLNKYWPSCEGSAESFWTHEWGKHGTCTGMTQLAYFSKALALLKQYSSQCDGSQNCNVCLTRDLSSTVQCNSR